MSNNLTIPCSMSLATLRYWLKHMPLIIQTLSFLRAEAKKRGVMDRTKDK